MYLDGPSLIKSWADHMFDLPSKSFTNSTKDALFQKIKLWLLVGIHLIIIFFFQQPTKSSEHRTTPKNMCSFNSFL